MGTVKAISKSYVFEVLALMLQLGHNMNNLGLLVTEKGNALRLICY